jgi:secondary thiamine-phosphate synthase enzyme
METKMATVTFESKKQFELIDVTSHIKDAVRESGVQNGIAVVYNPHTTAAIRVNHNEPLLLQDIMKMLFRLVPVDINYSHDVFELRENPELNERSNGHAHVKAFLLGSSESFIIESGTVLLGQKQSIFFVEFDGGRKRDFNIKIISSD